MPEPPPEFARWLTAARAGSRGALGQALQAYRRYLLQIAGHELDVELQAKGGASDLVQEAFLAADRDFGQFRGKSEAEFKAWLRQILLHCAAKNGRYFRGAKKRRVAREVPIQRGDSSAERDGGLRAAILSPSGEVMAKEQQEALERALERLPEDYRTVLHLRYREELSFEEIGDRMGRSALAARSLWSRAVERMKQDLRLSDEA